MWFKLGNRYINMDHILTVSMAKDNIVLADYRGTWFSSYDDAAQLIAWLDSKEVSQPGSLPAADRHLAILELRRHVKAGWPSGAQKPGISVHDAADNLCVCDDCETMRQGLVGSRNWTAEDIFEREG